MFLPGSTWKGSFLTAGIADPAIPILFRPSCLARFGSKVHPPNKTWEFKKINVFICAMLRLYAGFQCPIMPSDK